MEQATVNRILSMPKTPKRLRGETSVQHIERLFYFSDLTMQALESIAGDYGISRITVRADGSLEFKYQHPCTH